MKMTRNKWNVREESLALFLAFIIMFGYPFNMYMEYCVAALMAFSVRHCNPDIAIKLKSSKLFFVCGLIWAFSCLYGNNTEFALKYMFMYFAAYFVSINASTEIFRRMLKYLLILGGVHVSFIMLDFLNHDLVINVGSRFLSSEQLAINDHLHTWSGACAGLTGQTGQAALFVVIFMYAVVAFAAKDKLYVLLLAPAIIAVLLTQKRSFLGFGLLFSIGYLLYESKNIRNSSKVMLIVLGCATFFAMQYYIANYFDVSGIADKIEEGSMSNRNVLWAKMLDLFNSNPLLGIGLYSTDKIFGMTGHNIYIQLLCENGLLGASVFFIMLARSLFLAIKCRAKSDIVAFSRMTILFITAYGLFGNPIYEIQTLMLLMISATVLERERNRHTKVLIRKIKYTYDK